MGSNTLALNKRADHFPYQKRATSKKGKKFIEECVDSAINLAYQGGSNTLQTKKDMLVNYNLRADILDERDIEQTVNPWGIQGATFPAKMQNYPIANPKIDLLIGEEYKRRFDWHVVVVNPDAISQKEHEQREMVQSIIMDALSQNEDEYDEQEVQKRIEDFAKFAKYEMQDLRERRATQYLQYLWKEQDLKIKFNRGFEDALVAGMEVYHTDIVGGEPVVRKVDPLSLTVIGLGTSIHIEDADIIIEDTYEPLRWVIDNYYDYLTPKDIDDLERGVTGDRGSDTGIINYYPQQGPTNPISLVSQDGEDWKYAIIDTDDYSTTNVAAYNENGEVRVVRVTWVSLRKVGEIKWIDEEGNIQKKLVDENYKPDEAAGEEVEWFWINEWWEATRLAEDKYVKYGPRPIQFRSMGNKSIGGSGYVGTVYNTNTSQARSLMDRMKPYQYLYNVFMYRTELAFAKSKGKIGVIDASRIPDDWNMDKWMYYAEILGWAVEDPFKEGNKGAATGKLAGTMNQNSKILDLEMGNYIQQHVMMLEFIKQELGEIAGVTQQRQGQIDNRETVGGVERAVMQSSHITEKWFMLHDNTKVRVLTTLLETAKYAWRNKKSEKIQYISDEMASVISEIDGQLFNDADYGIMVSNSVQDTELVQAMKQLAQAGLQNDKINFSGIMDIYLSESISSMRRKIETYEEESEKRLEQQQQQQLEAQQNIAQQQAQQAQAEMQLSMREKMMDSETKITVAQINAESKDNADKVAADARITLEELRQEWKKIDNDYKVKTKELQEQTRHNKAQESIDKAALKKKPVSK